jgi:Predicted Peptidoglycan domain
MRESMNRMLEGGNMEKDMTNKAIAEDMTGQPYVPVPEEVRGEIPQYLLEPAGDGGAGTDIGGRPITNQAMNMQLQDELNKKFENGAGGMPAEAMPYQGQPQRPVGLRGTQASSDPLKSWVSGNTINWEARRDRQGNIAVYDIPAGDYGGTREVAGITDKYHPEAFKRISALPPERREEAVADYVLNYTSPVVSLVPEPLRAQAVDLSFNRGPTGYTKLVQEGLNRLGIPVKVDGAFGQKTLDAIRQADPMRLIDATEDAFIAREKAMAEADPARASLFRGITNRSNNRRSASKLYAREFATYPEAPTESGMPNIPEIIPNEPQSRDEYEPRPLGLGIG